MELESLCEYWFLINISLMLMLIWYKCYNIFCGFFFINIIKKEKERDRGICRKENFNF